MEVSLMKKFDVFEMMWLMLLDCW